MSNTMTCEGCDADSSSVRSAYEDGQPCPYCGLPAGATTELLTARKRGADEALIKRCAELEAKAADAVYRANVYRNKLAQIGRIVEGADKEANEKPGW